jgi:MATE family multidrug resistance protein
MKRLNREILNLAIPNIIANITIPLLGMVDLALVGHLESEIYIGAIALGGMIFNIIYWGFGFLRMGTSGFTAQAYGKKDQKEGILVLSRSLLVGIGGAIVLILLQRPIELLGFAAIKGSQEVEYFAAEYFRIRIWAAPATLALYAIAGWFIGMQNARVPMIIAIVVNILNIVFNLLFVLGLGMKSDGVALGTVLAQYGGLLTGIAFFIRKHRGLVSLWNYQEMIDWKALKRFFVVNRDIFIRTLCLIFVFSFFTSQSAAQDDLTLAVNTLLLQYFMVFSYLIDGFAYAAEALVGKYIGEQNRAMLGRTIRHLFIWGLGISIPFTLTYLFGGEKIIWILTNNAEVISQTIPFLFWVAVVPLVTFSAFLWDGIFIGATASAGMRNTMLLSTLFVFIPAYFIGKPILENHGLWLALILFMISRGLSQTLISKKEIFAKNFKPVS